MSSLIENYLVEERESEKRTTYALTERGTAVLRVLNFQKYLGRIKNTVRVMDDAMQVLSDISQNRVKHEDKNR
jgi:DNA-binding PadR family transcriptional regulator